MNPLLARKIKRKLQRELVKRELNQYFALKGYDENMDQPLYPPLVADLSVAVPHLFSRCEIVPFAESVDVQTGIHKIGWNLFVLGTNRLTLGYTSHTNATDVLRATRGEANDHMPADMLCTPNQLVEFVLKILDNSKNGYIELPGNFQMPANSATDQTLIGSNARQPRTTPTASGAFYSGPR